MTPNQAHGVCSQAVCIKHVVYNFSKVSHSQNIITRIFFRCHSWIWCQCDGIQCQWHPKRLAHILILLPKKCFFLFFSFYLSFSILTCSYRDPTQESNFEQNDFDGIDEQIHEEKFKNSKVWMLFSWKHTFKQPHK